MNLKKIMNMQRELDAEYTKSGVTKVPNLEVKRVIAILVELSEFANEYSAFKYWKKNKIINNEKLIEEFVDGVHFFCTFMNKYNVNENVIPKIISSDKSIQLMATFKTLVEMSDNINKETIYNSFSMYLGNASLLNISDNDIEEHYVLKNKINYERIKNGY